MLATAGQINTVCVQCTHRNMCCSALFSAQVVNCMTIMYSTEARSGRGQSWYSLHVLATTFRQPGLAPSKKSTWPTCATGTSAHLSKTAQTVNQQPFSVR